MRACLFGELGGGLREGCVGGYCGVGCGGRVERQGGVKLYYWEEGPTGRSGCRALRARFFSWAGNAG